MATTTKIRGITYNAGNTFKPGYSGTWYGSADGGNGSGSISTSYTVTFHEDRTGWADWYYHPILVSSSSFNGGVQCWTDASIFPYAKVTVNFNANGGTSVSSQTYTWNGGTSGNFPSTTRTGYKHVGWSIEGGTYSPTSSVVASWIEARNGRTLTAIAVWEAQASPISSAGDITYGTGTSTTGTVTWTPNNSGFKFKLKATLGSKSVTMPTSGYIEPNSTSAYTYTFSFDSTWIDQTPNSNTASVTYTLYTYSGSTELGNYTKTATLTVPTNIKPTISIGTIATDGTAKFNGVFATGVDKLAVPWSYDNTNDYSSPLGSLTCNVNGEILTASSGSSGTLKTANTLFSYGVQTVVLNATDARGAAATEVTKNYTVYWYFAPQVTVKYRHDSNGYFVNIVGKIAYVNNQNAKGLSLTIKDKDGTTTAAYDLTSLIGAHVSDSGASTLYDHVYPINIDYSIDTDDIPNIVSETYTFEVSATDTIYTSSNPVTASSVSGITVMSLTAGGTGLVIHKPTAINAATTISNGRLTLQNDSVSGGATIYMYPKNGGSSNRMQIDTSGGHLRVYSATLGGYAAQVKTTGYVNAKNGYEINGVQVQPPTVSYDTVVGSPNSDGVTSYSTTYTYGTGRKLIWTTASYSLGFPSTYGALYFSAVAIALPPAFFSTGTGNVHFIASARSSLGIYSTNVYEWNSSTGAVSIFVGTPQKPSSGNWSVQIELFGTKF